MNILLTCKHFLERNTANQFVETMYRTLALMGHHVAIRTFALDDIPRGFERDSGLEYDLALIYDHEPEYIQAKCKITVEDTQIPFPIDVGWLVANSPIGFAAAQDKQMMIDLENHDVVKIAKQYLKLAEHCLALSRN